MKKLIISQLFVALLSVLVVISGCEKGPEKPSADVQDKLVHKSIGTAIVSSRTSFLTTHKYFDLGGVRNVRETLNVRGFANINLKKYTISPFGKVVEKMNKDNVVKKMWPALVEATVDTKFYVYGLSAIQKNTEHIKYTIYFYQNENGEFAFENGSVESI